MPAKLIKGSNLGIPFPVDDLLMLFKRYGTLGYDKLSRPEQMFVCVWDLEGEVNNGGVDQYYFNTSGDHALDAPKALEAIAARHTSNLLRQANELFGESGPSPDRASRQKQLHALDGTRIRKIKAIEEEFFKYTDDLGKLLETYVSKNVDAFGLR